MYTSNDGKVIADYNTAYIAYQESQGYYYLDNFIDDYEDNAFKEFPHVDNMIECDDLMAPILNVLNSKGYKTKYSCQGHISKLHSSIYGFEVSDNNYFVSFCRPYIVFDESITLSDLGDFKVFGWNIECDEECCPNVRIYANRDYIEEAVEKSDSHYYKFYGVLLVLHNALYEWAKKLKDKNM